VSLSGYVSVCRGGLWNVTHTHTHTHTHTTHTHTQLTHTHTHSYTRARAHKRFFTGFESLCESFVSFVGLSVFFSEYVPVFRESFEMEFIFSASFPKSYFFWSAILSTNEISWK